MNTTNEPTCPAEREILRDLQDAGQVRAGRTPNDTPALIARLSNHRRACPFCNGTALAQLFGAPVVVGSPTEADHATQEPAC